jgi:hypothetical protein
MVWMISLDVQIKDELDLFLAELSNRSFFLIVVIYQYDSFM